MPSFGRQVVPAEPRSQNAPTEHVPDQLQSSPSPGNARQIPVPLELSHKSPSAHALASQFSPSVTFGTHSATVSPIHVSPEPQSLESVQLAAPSAQVPEAQ